MKDVANDMQNAIPTEFDTDMQINPVSSSANFYNNSNLIETFKEALKELKIELNDREVGYFVDTRIAKAV